MDTTGSMSTGSTTTTTTTGSYNGDTTSTGSDVSGSRSMPRTASDMPLVGLLGALALAGALGLRAAR
jgi:cobalamin biosynthesis Mg chelatase CobN